MPRSKRWYNKHEAEIMKRLGLTPTIASGAGFLEKEDGYNEYVLAQLKSTDANSIRITLEDIAKLEYHALVEHKEPMFVIDFIGPDKQYLMIPTSAIEAVYAFMGKEKHATTTQPTSVDLGEDFGSFAQEAQHNGLRKQIGSGDKGKYWTEAEKQRKKKWGK